MFFAKSRKQAHAKRRPVFPPSETPGARGVAPGPGIGQADSYFGLAEILAAASVVLLAGTGDVNGDGLGVRRRRRSGAAGGCAACATARADGAFGRKL